MEARKKAETRFPGKDSEGEWLCGLFGFIFLATRTMREYVSVVQATKFVVHILLQQLWEMNTTFSATCTQSCVALLVELKESVLIVVGLFVPGINLQADPQ